MDNWRSPWQIKLPDHLPGFMALAAFVFWGNGTARKWISARFTPEFPNRSQSTDAEE
jgi:hypothetical protein